MKTILTGQPRRHLAYGRCRRPARKVILKQGALALERPG
jgi:hypothetical protein